MQSAVDGLVNDAGWKLRMLIRTKRYYTDAELVLLYKSHLLAYLEYRTPAIYHSKREALSRLDRIQSRFLEDAGLSEADALRCFSLAPLAARRDIAVLGLIHRTVIGKGTRHFRKHFFAGDDGRLKNRRADIGGPLVTRSALGLAAIYNMLPATLKATRRVKEFQRRLQLHMKERLEDGREDWANTYSPRIALKSHPLRGC